MNARAIPRTVVNSYLRLVRLPLDGAVSLLPGNGTGAKPAAKLALDGADTTLRAVIATILRDPVMRQDAGPRGTAESAHVRWPSDDAKSVNPDIREREEQAGHPRVRSREDGHRRRQAATLKEENDQRQAAKVKRERSGASRGTAEGAEEVPLGGRAPTECVETVSVDQAPRREAEELTSSDPSDGPETWPRQLESAPSSRSHKEIADRAYELYRRGAPGDADAHWLAAEREVMSVSE